MRAAYRPDARSGAAGGQRSGAAGGPGVTRIEEILPPHTSRAWPAVSALRPHLSHASALVRAVDGVQRAQGYRLMGAFESPDADGDAVSVAGFRVLHTLAWGVTLYVDDLSTVACARGRGHAGALLHWLEGEAGRLACDELHLDSGVGPARHAAHRLYLNHGLAITAHHFARRLEGDPRR